MTTWLCRILGHAWRINYPRDAHQCKRCGILYARQFKQRPPRFLREMPNEGA